jgi:hypothetical protein
MYLESTLLTAELRKIEIMRGLLICGVFADPDSLVASQAFWLLKAALYDEADGPPAEPGPEVKELIAKYADRFEFRAEVTTQMIAAIPLFYDHGYASIKKALGSRGKVGTPIALYRDLLLGDPPLNDALSRAVMEGVRRNEKRANELRAGQLEAEQIDPAVCEKLEHCHEIYWEFASPCSRILATLAVPEMPETEEPRPAERAATNGFPFLLAKLAMETSAFQLTNKKRSPLAGTFRRIKNPNDVLDLMDWHTAVDQAYRGEMG